MSIPALVEVVADGRGSTGQCDRGGEGGGEGSTYFVHITHVTKSNSPCAENGWECIGERLSRRNQKRRPERQYLFDLIVDYCCIALMMCSL